MTNLHRLPGRLLPLVLLLTLGPVAARTARPDLPPLLPRLALFQDAVNEAPLVSPDGASLAWIAASQGLPNVWVRSVATNNLRRLSIDPRGTVRQLVWQADSHAVLYLQDIDGLGALHLMQAHVGSGTIRDLTPFTGVQARFIGASHRFPGQVLAALNLVDRRRADVFRIDVRTGAIAFVSEGASDITGWYADHDLAFRLAQVELPNGERALSTREDLRSMWRPLLRWGPDEATTRVIGFGPGNSNVWVLSSVQANAPRLLDLQLATGAAATLAQDPRYDITSVLLHPATHAVDAVQFYRARAQWLIANTNLVPDFEALRRFRDADFEIHSRDLADRYWTVGFTADITPVRYAVFDRSDRSVTPLTSERPGLDQARLAPARPFSFKARDGLMVEGYLTLPPGLEPKHLPTVVLVHSGPWSRVAWGFDPEAQWLANRGYAVVQPNYRGSTGYGKEHLAAGNKEWGGRILEDLIDARQWAVDQGTSDDRRIAIMGSGFGGYAVLAAMTLHPKAFTAGVSLAGPPSLSTLLKSFPSGATSLRTLLERRVGHLDKDAVRLREQSPINRAAFLAAPLLAAVCGRDTQVDLAEMDQFVATVRREGRNVEYLHFPGDTAALRDFGNRLRFSAAAEAFLSQHLGGRAEPATAQESVEKLRR